MKYKKGFGRLYKIWLILCLCFGAVFYAKEITNHQEKYHQFIRNKNTFSSWRARLDKRDVELGINWGIIEKEFTSKEDRRNFNKNRYNVDVDPVWRNYQYKWNLIDEYFVQGNYGGVTGFRSNIDDDLLCFFRDVIQFNRRYFHEITTSLVVLKLYTEPWSIADFGLDGLFYTAMLAITPLLLYLIILKMIIPFIKWIGDGFKE